jgi:hypothetical protein
MTTALGEVPLTVGSLHKWQPTITKDGAPWDLTALAVTLWWKRPNGSKFSQPADSTTNLGVVVYQDRASQLDAIGHWTLSAFIPGFGPTLPVPFWVIDSP